MSHRHILGKLLNFDLLRVGEKPMSELVDKIYCSRIVKRKGVVPGT